MGKKELVTAHDQKITHTYVVHYPAHYPRVGDPHYIDFEHYRKAHEATARCAFADSAGADQCVTDKPLELHHRIIEFSLQNGVDFAVLEKDFPGISNPDAVGAWVESDQNFEFLCLTPDSPVLMASGEYKPIRDVVPGDRVITKDGSPQLVTAHAKKPYRGDIFTFGSSGLTPTHRVLTRTGWVSASKIFEQFGMGVPDMVLVRGVKHQILRRVVGTVAINVMHSFRRIKFSAYMLFHYYRMLHAQSIAIPNPPIALGGYMGSTITGIPAGQRVEVSQPTFIRAKLGRRSTPVRSSFVRLTTPPTDKSWSMRWFAVDKPVRSFYSGFVHDISVAHNNSFVSSGIVVHNCQFHHRGHGGVHVASSSDFTAERYVKDVIS